LREAEVAVVAGPTCKATYTGLLELFLDQVGTGARRARHDRPRVAAARTAGRS
jgi:hypothetical protein